MSRGIVNLYRDQFGIRHGPGLPARLLRTRHLLMAAVEAAHLIKDRLRRITYEHFFWALITALLVVFTLALVTGSTGVARGGR